MSEKLQNERNEKFDLPPRFAAFSARKIRGSRALRKAATDRAGPSPDGSRAAMAHRAFESRTRAPPQTSSKTKTSRWLPAARRRCRIVFAAGLHSGSVHRETGSAAKQEAGQTTEISGLDQAPPAKRRRCRPNLLRPKMKAMRRQAVPRRVRRGQNEGADSKRGAKSGVRTLMQEKEATP